MQDKSERTPNVARSEAMRARLLQAARALMSEKGYAETSTPEVVKTAGVTRGALYHHFTDKADLFAAVYLEEARAVAAEINVGSADAADPLAAGTAAFFNAMSKPGRARILLLDAPAVLGTDEMARLDATLGGETLRAGLEAAMGAGAETSARADILSAGFDRAALAIANGADRAPYEAALRRLLQQSGA